MILRLILVYYFKNYYLWSLTLAYIGLNLYHSMILQNLTH